jgi:AcrR family transcriptional regulator
LDPPAPELDPYLDAAARCFGRHGFARTSIPDVARELGVSRATVYRRVGTVQRLARLLLAREIHAFLGTIGPRDALDRERLERLLTRLARLASEHPVLRKLISDEPDVIGRMFVAEYGRVLEVLVPLVAAGLRRAMRRGRVARRDPDALAESLVRIALSLLIAPPVTDAGAFVHEILAPVLEPAG